MKKSSKIFAGMDVHKESIDITLAAPAGEVRVPRLAVGFKPDTPFTRSAEPLVPIDSVKPYQRWR